MPEVKNQDGDIDNPTILSCLVMAVSSNSRPIVGILSEGETGFRSTSTSAVEVIRSLKARSCSDDNDCTLEHAHCQYRILGPVRRLAMVGFWKESGESDRSDGSAVVHLNSCGRSSLPEAWGRDGLSTLWEEVTGQRRVWMNLLRIPAVQTALGLQVLAVGTSCVGKQL